MDHYILILVAKSHRTRFGRQEIFRVGRIWYLKVYDSDFSGIDLSFWEELLSHSRACPIGSDQEVALVGCAVFEVYFNYAVAEFFIPLEGLAESDEGLAFKEESFAEWPAGDGKLGCVSDGKGTVGIEVSNVRNLAFLLHRRVPFHC